MDDQRGPDGSSITRATNGSILVYKGNSVTQSTSGITDTEDFDGLTGVHHCRITTASDAAFYASGNDFTVVLNAATIDGKAVNAVLAHFSIQNRYPAVSDMQSGLATAAALTTLQVVDDLEGRLTATRAGYLDALNSGVPRRAAAVDAVLDDVLEELDAAPSVANYAGGAGREVGRRRNGDDHLPRRGRHEESHLGDGRCDPESHGSDQGRVVVSETTLSVAAGTDDGYELSDGSVTLGSTSANCNASQPIIGFIIRSVPIPQGENVTAAHSIFTCPPLTTRRI